MPNLVNPYILGVDMQLLQKIVLSSPGTFTFSSINQSYGHLKVIVIARDSGSSPVNDTQIQFNGDTSSSYTGMLISTQSTAPLVGEPIATTTFCYVGQVIANTSAANVPGSIIIDIPGYSGTTFCKQFTSFSSTCTGTLNTTESRESYGTYLNTAAITSISIFDSQNFVTGSTAWLYGY